MAFKVVYKINLRLILVSGKTKEFLFSPSDSAGDIAHHVFENWPEDWAEEAVAKAEILRLIYQGRFLHSNVTLGALGLPFGKTTVMHLVPRENLPEPNSQGDRVEQRHDHDDEPQREPEVAQLNNNDCNFMNYNNDQNNNCYHQRNLQ
ncbi:ubiquitin like 3 isoform X2 [Megalopta genalis]|uniref:ubiquitin like 3 isoform X2 n=1 Tax=Megalopta genalis TaxID=115081 RepID=UPI001443808E|nr:ubiquitin-like protein 3 isoform X2 [Megalopta genalis]